MSGLRACAPARLRNTIAAACGKARSWRHRRCMRHQSCIGLGPVSWAIAYETGPRPLMAASAVMSGDVAGLSACTWWVERSQGAGPGEYFCY